jgi:hypothetical protein
MLKQTWAILLDQLKRLRHLYISYLSPPPSGRPCSRRLIRRGDVAPTVGMSPPKEPFRSVGNPRPTC